MNHYIFTHYFFYVRSLNHSRWIYLYASSKLAYLLISFWPVGIINAQEETGSERQWNIKKSRSNRGMPAVQEHLNGATGRTSIARCGLPCCRSESRRRGSRFEEAVVDWKSYMLPVEWTISLSLLHCERLFCCPFSFLSLPLFQLWADARLGVLARNSCCCTHCSLSFLEFRVPSFFLWDVDTRNRAVSSRPAPRFSFVDR